MSSLFRRRRRRRRRRRGFRLAATLRAARQDGVHLVAFHPRHRFREREIRQLSDQPLENPPPDLGMRHLPAAEEDRRLDLVAILEEALDVLLLELVVVLVDLGAELDLFDLDHLLVLPSLTRALLLLVLILAEIHDAADRRHRRRRDLDQVEPLLLGDGESLRRRHDAELCARIVDHSDFTDPDAFVYPRAVVTAGTSVKSDKASLHCLSSCQQAAVQASFSTRHRQLRAVSWWVSLARDLVTRRGNERVYRARSFVAAGP